jgi:predicted RecA/RadA family phage recombinase
MAFSDPQQIHTFDAGAGGVRPNRIVKQSARGEVVEATASTDLPFGVALDYQKAERTAIKEGEQVDVAEDGVVRIEAGASVSIGDKIAADADGRAQATTTGADEVIGIAQNATSGAGELVTVKIDRFTL